MTGRQRKTTYTTMGTRKLEMLEITTAVRLQHFRLVLHRDPIFENPKTRTYKNIQEVGGRRQIF
jgi:hypothetical protein